ncbi:hypothetical protein J437_LFUL014549 [Ladona fulva]|uniref:Uncharacterized protein n=1 Tax=Ladona fulva TaxID=123851 RepID=A0A8K0KS80_LADFU|nr:hypothetical protein J437_LFUL014549 [Ladona fulva]
MLTLHGDLVVDTFFTVGAFLLAYSGLKDSRTQPNIAIMYLIRYIRLTPAYALVLFFYATVLNRLGSGPLWHASVTPESSFCAKNWWTNLLYVSNYVNTGEMVRKFKGCPSLDDGNPISYQDSQTIFVISRNCRLEWPRPSFRVAFILLAVLPDLYAWSAALMLPDACPIPKKTTFKASNFCKCLKLERRAFEDFKSLIRGRTVEWKKSLSVSPCKYARPSNLMLLSPVYGTVVVPSLRYALLRDRGIDPGSPEVETDPRTLGHLAVCDRIRDRAVRCDFSWKARRHAAIL